MLLPERVGYFFERHRQAAGMKNDQFLGGHIVLFLFVLPETTA
jgi:hypothetical protein